jgi:hypothetical protein
LDEGVDETGNFVYVALVMLNIKEGWWFTNKISHLVKVIDTALES